MKHRCLFPAAVCGSLSIILIVLVRCVDVAPIGAEATNIGLSHLNGFVFKRRTQAGWRLSSPTTKLYGILRNRC